MIKITADYIMAESRIDVALRQGVKVYSWLCQTETYYFWWSLNIGVEKTSFPRSRAAYPVTRATSICSSEQDCI